MCGDYFCPHSPRNRRHNLDSRDPGRVGDVSSCSCCPCAPHRVEYETRDLRCKRSPSLMKTSSWSSFCIKSGVNPANGLAATGDWGQDPSVTVVPGIPHVAQLSASSGKSPWIRQLPSVGGAQGSSIRHPVILESPDGTDMEQLGPWS